MPNKKIYAKRNLRFQMSDFNKLQKFRSQVFQVSSVQYFNQWAVPQTFLGEFHYADTTGMQHSSPVPKTFNMILS